MPTPIKSQDRDEATIYLATGAGIGSIGDPFNPALPTGAATEATLTLTKTATEAVQAVAGSDSTKATAIQGITGGKDITISSIDLGIKADSAATDSTSSWSAIALLKGLFLWTKGDRGAGNVSSSTQRVTLSNDSAGVASLASIVTSQAITYIESPVVSIGLTSTQSAVVGASTNRVIITPTIDCWVAMGSNPTATVGTTGSFFLAGGIPSLPITVTPSTTKLAVISNDSATGKLSILGIS